jgi:tetratricopeptide (TPR) repeat protein
MIRLYSDATYKINRFVTASCSTSFSIELSWLKPDLRKDFYSIYRIMLLLLILVSVQLKATYRSEIYNAYISNKMELWKEVIDRMDTIKGKSDEMLLELVNYQYGYIGYCIGYNKKDEAGEYLDLAEKNLKILEKKNYDPSEINAYKSAFYGFRIELNIIIDPVIGIKSIESARKAVELDQKNYFGHIQLGNIEFYMPAAFGGSKRDALTHYLKAKELMERNPENTDKNWNYLSLLLVIGQSHYYLHDYTSASKVYERILELEPGFLYVRNELLPQVMKKIDSL